MSRYKTGKNRKEAGIPSSVIAGFCLMLFLFSLAVVLVLNARWLYYLDITLLKLDQYVDMTVEQIRANYDALIRYNSLFFRGALAFPTLPMSREGAIHFEEVKRIFDALQVLCIAAGLFSLFWAIYMHRKNSSRWLKIAGVSSIAVPAVLGTLIALNWENFFVTFHHLFFQNDYWLFDPATDPVILILPDTYFLHCAVGILGVVLLGSVLFLVLGFRRKNSKYKYRKSRRTS